jgi:hypothetical protein
MKKILFLGILAILTTVSLTTVVVGDNKTIDTDQFSFGDQDSFVNMTTKEVVVGDDLYSHEANLFVYNNATYDWATFEITGGPNPTSGEYLSEVNVDLGNNGKVDYRFGGTGTGYWGKQNVVRVGDDDTYIYAGNVYPSPEGDLYYLKLPSNAVVSSTSVELEHRDTAVYMNPRIPASAAEWAYEYFYYSGYGYFNPSSSYVLYYLYPYYYPHCNGFLKWDIEDPELNVPVGATILSYDLVWMLRAYAYTNYLPPAGSYHFGERYYDMYGITEKWPGSGRYPSSGYFSGSESQILTQIENYLPDYQSTSLGRVHLDDYFGNNRYPEYYGINWDLSDLYEDWVDGTVENHGVMVAMTETPYKTGMYHYSGYSSSNSNWNSRYYFYRGFMYPPGYSTASWRPSLRIGYVLDSLNPWIDVGDDSNNDWSYPGTFSGTTVATGWQNSINQYLRTHFPDEVDEYGNEWTYVPVRLGADSAGEISIRDIQVMYNYTATVFYNPNTGSLLGDLQNNVPAREEGWTLIPLNVSSDSTGSLRFDNLELTGEKPNYPPKFSDVPQVDTLEGTVEPKLLKLNDFVYDIDQDDKTLTYIVQMNDQEMHVDLDLNVDEEGMTWLGLDTSKDEHFFGEVTCQISVTDEFGKDAWSNEFIINIQPVNDFPILGAEIEDINTLEGIDPIFLEYSAPSGRNIARGKTVFKIGGEGQPYFWDLESDMIYMDFELLGQDMQPVSLDWSNADGYKIYRGPDNEAYLTVLPPEYTDDPDNYMLVFGSEPDFTTKDGPYYLNIYASDDPLDTMNQTMTTVKIFVEEVNDPPSVLMIPDIVMNEDETYVSSVDFINEYVTDVDTDMEDLRITFTPTDDAVHVSLNEEGKLVIDLDLDFNGVVPVNMEVYDGVSTTPAVFNVRVRSVNDPPILVVDNIYDGQVLREMYRLKGTADDIEKNLRSVEVAVKKVGDIIYTDDWVICDGVYVWQYLIDIRDFEEGDYIVYIRAFDGRDFSEIYEYNIEVIPITPPPPSPPPEVTITTPLTGEISGSITVTGTVMDEKDLISFVEYRVDGDIWRKAAVTSAEDWQLILDTKTLTNGEHNLSVRAYDEKTYSEIVFKKFTVYNEDSDGDGIPNDIERTLLMDPFNKLDGTMDFDNDGFSNQAELIEHGTDPFDGRDHPAYEDEEDQLLDTWAMIFIAASILCAIVIIGLFILNIKLERNIHSWREDLNRRRVERKPKTLLQKIVEIAPTFVGAPAVPEGPALPGGQPAGEQHEALPPMQEGDTNPPA